jgi:hypothetical protein
MAIHHAGRSNVAAEQRTHGPLLSGKSGSRATGSAPRDGRNRGSADVDPGAVRVAAIVLLGLASVSFATPTIAGLGLVVQIHVGRVGRAYELVKGAEHQLYLRISRALAELPPWRCNESFPILYSFYLHLPQLPREQYVRIRTATRFTRTHILLQSTSCFRQLLTIEPGARYARPEVITGPFGGRSTEMVATELKRNPEFELRMRRIESGDAENAGRGCDGTGAAEPVERKICKDLAHLDELATLLIEENTHAEDQQ